MLKEIADPALGGGVTNLMERFGRNVEQLEDVQLIDTGAENTDEITAFVGADGGMTTFTFTNNADLSGSGVALFSQSLEALVPEDLLASGSPALRTEAELSPDEMNDILSGFGSETGGMGDMGGGGGGGSGMPTSENMEMVLDIGLIATARLGRVEMPIGEVLNLGPGSIIEVGHLVDEPVDLLVNGKLIARGDVVVVDEKFGIRITEIVSTRARIESLR
jgi:flagellar motor switch protein FliN